MANINSVNGIALGGQTASITLPSLNTFNDKYGTYDNKVTHPDDMEMFRVDAGGQNNVQQVVPRKVSWLDKIVRFFKYLFSTDTTMKATSRAFFDDVSRMFNGKIPPKVMNAMGKHCKEDGVEKPVLLSQVRNVQTLASQALDEAQMQAIMDNPEYRYEMMHEQYIEGMTNEQKTDYIKTEKENEAYQKKDFDVDSQVVYKKSAKSFKQLVDESGVENKEVPVEEKVPNNKEVSVEEKVPNNKEVPVEEKVPNSTKVPVEKKTPDNKKVSPNKIAKGHINTNIVHEDLETNTEREIWPQMGGNFNSEKMDLSFGEDEGDGLYHTYFDPNISKTEY